MSSSITKTDSPQREADTAPQIFDDWFDPIETEVRDRARQFIEELIRSELDAALARPRYGQAARQVAALRAIATGAGPFLNASPRSFCSPPWIEYPAENFVPPEYDLQIPRLSGCPT